MYVTIRKYAGKGGLMDRLAPPVRDGLVPLLKRAPGFRAEPRPHGIALGPVVLRDLYAAA